MRHHRKLRASSIAFLLLASAAARGATFYRDVLPILQAHCQACHRPGQIGPMPLLTWSEARPWAAAIRESVALRKMPPWFADPRFGHFANDPSLSAEEIGTITSWANSGASAGSSSDAPPLKLWTSGWSIAKMAKTDIVLSMPRAFKIPAKGVVDYQYFVIPADFSADVWAKAIEIRPTDRTVVHHAVLYVREPGSSWLRDSGREPGHKARETTADILAIYTPGAPATVLPDGMAKKIPFGSDLVLQMHYTAKDRETQDQTQIGLVLMKGEPQRRVMTLQMGADRLDIQPGEHDYRASVSGTLPQDALLLSLFPHMHLRGSAFEYQIVGPRGQAETLLRVKPYDSNWQLSYQLKTPRLLKAGTRLLWTGHFDNSANNPRNPDPTAEVVWGEQIWQEMMIGFFDVAVPVDVDKAAYFVRSDALP